MITSAIRLMVVALGDIQREIQMDDEYHEIMMCGHIAYFMRMYVIARVLCGMRIRRG